MNERKVLVVLGVVALAGLIGGYLLFTNKPTKTQAPQEIEENVPIISVEELGLTLSFGSGKRTVMLGISNTEDLKSVEYELSYTSKDDIPRGAIGQIEVKNPGRAIRQEIVLGTCSDVCHYDEDVSNIKLVLKVTKSDGKIFQAEKSLEL